MTEYTCLTIHHLCIVTVTLSSVSAAALCSDREAVAYHRDPALGLFCFRDTR